MSLIRPKVGTMKYAPKRSKKRLRLLPKKLKSHLPMQNRRQKLADWGAFLRNPCVMGVINVSPNSFFAPCLSISEVVDLAGHMLESGADILDVGGEATNPGTQGD